MPFSKMPSVGWTLDSPVLYRVVNPECARFGEVGHIVASDSFGQTLMVVWLRFDDTTYQYRLKDLIGLDPNWGPGVDGYREKAAKIGNLFG